MMTMGGGHEEERRQAREHREEASVHRCHSVMTGSNVHRASVRNTASKKNSRPIQSRAIARSGSGWMSTAVPLTPMIAPGW